MYLFVCVNNNSFFEFNSILYLKWDGGLKIGHGSVFLGIRSIHSQKNKKKNCTFATMQVVFSFYWGFIIGIRHYEPTEQYPYTEGQFFLGPVCITLTDRNFHEEDD